MGVWNLFPEIALHLKFSPFYSIGRNEEMKRNGLQICGSGDDLRVISLTSKYARSLLLSFDTKFLIVNCTFPGEK